MFSNYLSSIDGVEIFPIITLIIFVAVFLLTVVWTFKKDESYLAKMSNMPIDSEDDFKNYSRKKNDAD